MKNEIPKLSIFYNSVSSGKNPSGTIDIISFLQDGIMKGLWKDTVNKVRAIKDHEKRQEYKRKNVPSVTVSGEFKSRKDSDLLSYSGLIAIDIDHLEKDMERVRAAVVNDPYTYAAFTSVGGAGLCVIIKTTQAANHQDHFRWAQEHYLKIGGVDIDPSCRNISRARFVSYDPDIYIDPNSKVAGKKAEPKNKPSTPKFIPTTNGKIDRIVSEICGDGHNIAEEYPEWISLAFSLANELGEGGRQHFHNLSMISGKYSQKEVDKQYTDAVKNGRGDITIATFFQMAKDVGIEINTAEEKKAYTIAKAAKQSKTDIEAAIQTAKHTGVNVELTKEIAEKVFESDQYDDITEGDSIINEIATFIKLNCNLERNIITSNIENNGEPITDQFYNTIYIKAKSCIVSKEKVSMQDVRAIIESDLIPTYCPIQRWLDHNQHYPDKPEIIDQLLDTIPYETPEAREFIRPWLLGIPATYYGDVVRLVLVLCGKQETGKTFWLRELFPPELKEYWSDNSLMDESEVPLIMSRNLANLDDEFGGKSRKDALKFKELTSKKEFNTRLKYGRTTSRLRRICMLCGTSNEVEILNDETGNTRILPVEFNKPYDWEAYNKIDKAHLMVEIFRAHKRGESWQLNETARTALNKINDIHKISDFELELVDLFFEEDKTPHSVNILSTTEIKVIIEKYSGQKIMSIRKLGVALKKRFDQKMERIDGKVKRGYKCVPKSVTPQPVVNQDVTAPF